MQPSYVHHVRQQVLAYGETRSYTYLREAGRELVEETATFRDLDRDARAVAAWLAARPESSEPVVLLYLDGMAFLRAFLGCLYAGVIAVPAPLPHDERSTRRVAGIIADSGARMVLTTANFQPMVAAATTAAVVATDEQLGDPDAWRMPAIDAGTIAFLQYTSGSTGTPKGVVVTHGNLLHNEAAITAIGFNDTATGVSWIPQFHDMGLIGSLLGSIYAGANLVFMSPTTFLKRPVRWLQTIDKYRATFTAAPNFAYELIAKRVTHEQLADLDLSTLEVALCGAEPVRERTIAAVRERFAPAGWRPTALLPAYGLAEATLLATAGPIDAQPVVTDGPDSRLVGCGQPARGLTVRVVDPHTGQQAVDDTVGEIWIQGDSVAAGYWNRPEETRHTFDVYLGDEGPFLRTGDLGMLRDGELFVTGRLKDLLIINGRNLYPQDVEELVEQLHPALTTGVAVSVEAGGRERLVVVQGIKTALLRGTTLAELTSSIKIAVARGFDVPAPSVVLVESRSVHRTTSGKVQRASMREAFLDDSISTVLHEDLEPALSRSSTATR
ncbi:fatty acyl-AMP ligase [Nocardia salmonicida]|uniref:fatty acyl-AMP ligase n=1 Tax=Nocardia salmonicida TaxID=53431 RepID=UPI0007A3A3B0|nr:fatty acyl-AMP ligase [Nocardia salmonicida]